MDIEATSWQQQDFLNCCIYPLVLDLELIYLHNVSVAGTLCNICRIPSSRHWTFFSFRGLYILIHLVTHIVAIEFDPRRLTEGVLTTAWLLSYPFQTLNRQSLSSASITAVTFCSNPNMEVCVCGSDLLEPLEWELKQSFWLSLHAESTFSAWATRKALEYDYPVPPP